MTGFFKEPQPDQSKEFSRQQDSSLKFFCKTQLAVLAVVQDLIEWPSISIRWPQDMEGSLKGRGCVSEALLLYSGSRAHQAPETLWREPWLPQEAVSLDLYMYVKAREAAVDVDLILTQPLNPKP